MELGNAICGYVPLMSFKGEPKIEQIGDYLTKGVACMKTLVKSVFLVQPRHKNLIASLTSG